MKDSSFQKVAAIAAFVVALSSLSYAIVYLLFVPASQKPIGSGASLTSFAANPTGRELASILLTLGGLGAAGAAIGIYRRVREVSEGWALSSLLIGFIYGLLTALYGMYIVFLFPGLSSLYTGGNAATQAAVVATASLPSPLDPYGFTKFFLSGIWLLITAVLMIRSGYFARALGYLALVAGVGVILLFIGNATQTLALILATGGPGAAIIGPVFWAWVGYTLWSKP